MSIYFIADTHFGDQAIGRYENRPFPTTAEMDEEMVRHWNAEVNKNDVVYHLGDFGAEGYEAHILSELNGIKYLVKGNHDEKSNETYRSFGFNEVYDHPILLNGFWLLSHEPLYVNVNMPYVNLFGHVHNNPIIRDFSPHHFCVSVERIDYTPISFENIRLHISQAIQNG